jgi:hypothetical protein
VIALPLDVLVAALRRQGADQPHAVLATTSHWLDDTDRPTPTDAVDDAAWILARPTAECFGWLCDEDGAKSVLAAERDGRAVLVARNGGMVDLRPIAASCLVERVVDQLPNVPAARGRSLNVRIVEAETQMRRLMAQPRRGSGQLHVAERDSFGRRRRSPRALCYLDTMDGRWMTQLTANGWVYAAPATGRTLSTKLTEMRRNLA